MEIFELLVRAFYYDVIAGSAFVVFSWSPLPAASSPKTAPTSETRDFRAPTPPTMPSPTPSTSASQVNSTSLALNGFHDAANDFFINFMVAHCYGMN